MRSAVYIIKPEALQYADCIRQMITAAGLQIVDYRVVTFEPEEIDGISEHVKGDLRKATHRYYSAGPCEIGIVQGERAFRQLADLCGHAVAPRDCGTDTIRARFGILEPVEFGSALYYLNGFHCSRTEQEAESDRRVFDRIVGRQAT